MAKPISGPFEREGPDAFRRAAGVSRETLDRLERLAELLVKWQRTINLVGASSLRTLWSRHMLDSAQLFPLIPKSARVLVDLGSGAGFPGLVLAILGVPKVYLVESDSRKCAFLIEAARVSGMVVGQQVEVSNVRIERFAAAEPVDVITSRGLGRLDRLLTYSAPNMLRGTICLFPRGLAVDAELTEAVESWNMQVERIPSRTDPSGTILRLSNVERRAEG